MSVAPDGRRSKAADTLRAALIRQFGPSAQDAIDVQVQKLQGRSKLNRHDLEEVEQGVLASLRQRRDSAASCASRPTSQWNRNHGIRPTTTPQHPTLPNACKSASAPSLSSTGFSWRNQMPCLRPKMRPLDHFDVMTDFDQKQYWQTEANKKALHARKRADVVSGLEAQLLERRDALNKEADLRKAEREAMQAHVASFERDTAVDKERHTKIRDAAKLKAAEDKILFERRQTRKTDKVKEQCDEMRQTQNREHQRLEQQVLDKQALFEKRCKENREYLARTQAEREQRRSQQVASDRATVEEAQKAMDRADAQKAAAVKHRQDKVDLINSTMGAALAERRLQQEREADEKIEREAEEFELRRLQRYWRDEEERDRKLQDVIEVNAQQLRDKASRETWEQIDDRKQLEVWRKSEEAECPVRAKAAKSKRLREEMDEALMEEMHRKSTIHRSEAAVQPLQRQREVSYNKRLLEQIHADGFAPHVTSAILTAKQR